MKQAISLNSDGSGINIVSLKEVYHQNSNLNYLQKVMRNIRKEDSIKENYLHEFTEKEKKIKFYKCR